MTNFQVLFSLSLICVCAFSFRGGQVLSGRLAVSAPPLRAQQRSQQHPSSIDLVLSQCKKTGDFSSALALAEKLEQSLAVEGNRTTITAAALAGAGVVTGPSQAVTSIIRLYGEAGELGRALSTLNRIQSDWHVEPCEHHFGALIQAARKSRQCDIALELFERMKSRFHLKRNTVVYNCMIRAASEAGRLELVLDLFSGMEVERVPKDAFTFSGVISACEQLGQWERAVRFYDEMLRDGVARPSVVVLNTCLQACVTGRQWRRALELLVQAKNNLSLEPDAISYSLVITACGLAQQKDIAERVFRSFPNQQRRDTGLCNAMLTAYERSGVQYWPQALDLLQEMASGKVRHARPDSKSFAVVITACGRAGEWKRCMELYAQMGTQGIPKDKPVYNAVITALQSAGQWDQARHVLQVSSDDGGVQLSAPPPMLTAAEIFEASQEVYADGLMDGMFQHWASPLKTGPSLPVFGADKMSETESLAEFNLSSGVDKQTSAPYRYMDLHNFQASVAKTAVSFVFNEMDETACFDLRIITGRGNHINSSGERGVLRAELEAHIKALEPQGILNVEPVSGNDGCIVVTKESIALWLRTRK